MATVSIDLELLTKTFDRALQTSTRNADKLADTIESNARKSRRSMQGLADETRKTGNAIENQFTTAKVAVGAFVASLAANIVIGTLRSIGEAASASARNFIELEVAQVGVAKTTNLTDEELVKLSDTFVGLSRRIPTSTVELLRLGQVAGQLGVEGADNIALFAETISKLGVASDISGEAAAQSLIRILNLSNESADNIDNLASSIVDLGNNFAATESEITGVANEVAKSTAQFKIGSANVVGISTALKTLGQQAQLGGSVVGKTFRTINDAIARGGKTLDNFAKISQTSVEEFTKVFREDATEGFQVFIEGLSRLPAEELSLALESVGLKGDEVNKVLPALASRVDILTDALNRSNTAFTDNTALNEEAERGFDTLSAKLDILGNNFTNLGTQIFSIFAPAIEGAVEIMNAAFDAFTERTELEEAKANLEELLRLQEQFADSPAISDATIEYRNGVESSILKLQQFIKAQEDAANAAKQTFVEASAGQSGLEQRLATLQNELKTIESGFGAAFGFDKEKVLSEIQEVESELARLRQASTDPEDNTVSTIEKRNQDIINKEIELQEQLRVIKEQAKLAETERELLEKERQGQATEAELLQLQNIELQKQQIILDSEERKAKLIEDSQNKKLALDIVNKKRELAITQDAANRELEVFKKAEAGKQRVREVSLQATRNFLSAGISLAKKGSAEYKALSIADATINTYAGATKALNDSTVPSTTARFALAASVIAQGLANVGRITGANFQQGGVVAGSSFVGDNVPINVNSGEMILNRSQQAELFNQANGGGTSTSQADLNQIVEAIRGMNITLVADDNEIARSTSRGVSNGVVIGESE